MMPTGKLAKAKVIFLDEFMQSIKTKKALIIIVSYIFLMFLGIKTGSLFEVFAWAVAGSRQSFSVLLPYYISVALLPLFSIIISYNILSEEISRGSIKFIACRADRISIITGKIASSFAISTSMVLISYIIALFFIHSKVGLWFFIPYALSFVYLSIYALAFICLTAFISMAARTPSYSIVLSLLVSITFAVFLNFNYIKFISPFYFSNKALEYIMNGFLSRMLLGLAVLSVHAALYFMLSYAILKKSDLF